MSFFTQTKAINLLDGKLPSVSVDKTTTVIDTLKILYDTGFSSLTVSDPTIDIQPKRIAGFIDLLDILSYLVTLCNAGFSNANDFLLKPVGDLMDYSSRDHFTAVLEEDDLLKVITHLSKEGVHRVAVVDIMEDIRYIITQTDIARVIQENMGELINVSRVSVRDLGVAHTQVISTRSTENKAIDSLRLMNSHRLSAVPIVNEAGVLVGTLSISDLKGFSTESLQALLSSTLAFSEKHSYKQGSAPKAISVTLDSTFGDVINLMVHARVHRVWVVDSDHRPIGVISLTDVCRIIARLHAPAM